MKYLSIQTFQCGISVSGAATFTGGASINLLSLNGATTSSEASLFLGAHGTNEGGQLVLQKGTSNTYAAHLDNYSDQFRIMYGTNTGSAGVALTVNLATRQLVLSGYTSTTSFTGTAVGYLAFDSSGNIITTASPAGAVTSIIAGTGVSVSSGTGNVTISIGQSVATSAQVTFDSVITNNNGNGTNLRIGDDVWIGDVNVANTFRVTGAQSGADGYIIFGNANSDALGRSGTGNLTYAGSTVWTAATLTNLNQLTNGPGYITSASLSGYVPTSRTLTINGTSYDLSANRTWTINTVDYTSRLQHQVKAGVAINKGQAVYVTSADGTNMIVGLASNASEATSSKTMGLLDATVSTNGFANVVTEGLLAGLDTSTAGSEGDPVWLGTGGNLIYGLANKPSAPAHLVFIGIVTRKNNSNGEIFVKVQNGFELNEIHDVDLKTNVPVNGEILGYNGTLWVNKTIAGWLGYTPANASGTTNYVAKFTGSTTLGNSQIFDNGTNVGIGTSSPSYTLDINGSLGTRGGAGIGGTGGWGGSTTWGLAVVNNSNAYHQTLIHCQSSILSLFANPQATTQNSFPPTSTGLASSSPIVILTSNTERMRITTGGNVGIGTANPVYKLQVASGDIAIDYNRYIRGGGGGDWNLINLYNGGTGDIEITMLNTNWYLRHNANATFAGNVGIGTTSPTDKLTIAGNTNVGEYKVYNGSLNNSAGFDLGGSRFNIHGYYGIVFNSSNNAIGSMSERMRITDTGNVGIGTTAPAQQLHVAQNIALGLTGGSAGDTNNILFPTVNGTHAGVPNGIFYTKKGNWGGQIDIRTSYDWGYSTDNAKISLNGAEGNGIVFYTGASVLGASERVRITGTGNVAVNTTDSSLAKLRIVGEGGSGNAALMSDYANPSVLGEVSTIAHRGGQWHTLYVSESGASATNAVYVTGTKPIILNAGNVGIGTTSPYSKLDVNGTISIKGAAFATNDSTYTIIYKGQSNSIGMYLGGSGDPSSYYDNSNHFFRNSGGGSNYGVWNGTGLGIGTTSPSQLLHVAGNLRLTGAFYDSNNQAGSAGQILKSTGTGTDWVSLSEITGVDGSGTANYVTKWSDSDTVTNSLIYDNGTNVGIGTTSPGYNLDVNGQVRVQDKLRVGNVNSGNGVVHMSSSATINPSATTIVWSQSVSVGMCAFIEYYILNNNTGTDQRAGTIVVTWNQSGTPTIAHTETTTTDIGSTTAISFTSSLVGADARINAVNSSSAPYTMVMNFRYF